MELKMTELPFKEDAPQQCQNPQLAIQANTDALIEALKRGDAHTCAEIAKVVAYIKLSAEAQNKNNEDVKNILTKIFSDISNVEALLGTNTDITTTINTILESHGESIEIIRQGSETNKTVSETNRVLANNLQTITNSLATEIENIKTQLGNNGSTITLQDIIDKTCVLANNICDGFKASTAKLNAYNPIACVYEAPTPIVSNVFASFLTTSSQTPTQPNGGGSDDLAPA